MAKRTKREGPPSTASIAPRGAKDPGRSRSSPPCDRTARGRLLTEKESRFVLAYMGEAAGNGTQAARLAGYNGTPGALAVRANALLKKSKIAAEIERLRTKDTAAKILDREERQAILSRIATEGEADRTKAIDILNKMDGLYISKVEVSGKVSAAVAAESEEKLRDEVLSEWLADPQTRAYLKARLEE